MKNYLLLAAICLSPSFIYSMQLQESRLLHSTMRHATYTSPTFPVHAQVVTIPLEDVNVQLIPAIGQREAVTSIARRTGATVAINGGNYRRGGNFNGNRVNLFYLHNTIYSDLQLARGAFCWDSKNKAPIIDTVFLDIDFTINGLPLPVTAINQPRIAGQSVLYTAVADTALLTYTPGRIIVINADGVVASIGIEIPETIPDNWLIYQVDTECLTNIKPGMPVQCTCTLRSTHTQESYNNYDFVLAGAGLLLRNAVLLDDELYQEFTQGTAIVHCSDEIAADFITKEMQEWLIELRHPRTAIGITAQNEVCIVVVDGRQEESEGLSLRELALFMQQLGCTDALNIGGGGCTTLCIDTKLMNNPSNYFFSAIQSSGQERPVSEALCFFKQTSSENSF